MSSFSKRFFGFDEFKIFPELNAGVLDNPTISQREIIEASLQGMRSVQQFFQQVEKHFTFLASSGFQSKAYKALTVVISPLQALIEDHIKSFNAKVVQF